jgi:hypothetical protein
VSRRRVKLDACGQAPCPSCGEVLTNEGRVCRECEFVDVVSETVAAQVHHGAMAARYQLERDIFDGGRRVLSSLGLAPNVEVRANAIFVAMSDARRRYSFALVLLLVLALGGCGDNLCGPPTLVDVDVDAAPLADAAAPVVTCLPEEQRIQECKYICNATFFWCEGNGSGTACFEECLACSTGVAYCPPTSSARRPRKRKRKGERAERMTDACSKCGRELGEHDGKKCPPKSASVTSRSQEDGRSSVTPLGNARRPPTVTEVDADRHESGNACVECGAAIPETRPRSRAAFGGRGQPRQYCGPKCRQRASRAKRGRAPRLWDAASLRRVKAAIARNGGA